MQQPHRPGPLHQTNKPHKTPRHSRKASATSEIKTKIVSRSSSISSNQSLARTERLNQANQNRKLKWEKAISSKRSLGAGSQAPINVGILGASDNFVKGLQSDDESATLSTEPINDRVLYVLANKLKMRFKLISLDCENFDETIDLIKTIDLIFLIHNPDDIDQEKHIRAFDILQVIYIHCLPTIVHVIDGFGRKTPSMAAVKRKLKSKLDEDKLHAIESYQDYGQLFHIAGSSRRQKSVFKEARPMVSSDKMSVVDGRLVVTGFVRNKALNPNDLVHIPGFDDYQLHKIEILPDIVSLRPQSVEGDQVVQTLVPDLMNQESLDQEHEMDPMEGEQNFPIAEDDVDFEDAMSEQDEDQIECESDYMSDEVGCDEEQDGDDAEDDDDGQEQGQMDYGDMECDDEIDGDENARIRYARYRGLKSFRTSNWDPEENLPPDYSRIYQFQNFQQTKRRVMGDSDFRDGANSGLYVRVHLANVPEEDIQKLLLKSIPTNLIALLKYERKITVMNLLIKRLPEVRTPIKSKEELVFYVGFRKFKARPLFTSNTISTKFKYERFLKNDTTMVATLYAPITFPPAPVLVFRNKELVASGSVLDSNPKRMIIKRIRLTGHPFKIHSKTAVIRSMFFNSDDVLYFKPVELVTKHGKRGHISEPLGTHGHMKCLFDKKIRSDDCVYMNLYKRVFPKWTYATVRE